MNKTFIISDSKKGILFLHFLKKVIKLKGNMLGAPNTYGKVIPETAAEFIGFVDMVNPESEFNISGSDYETMKRNIDSSIHNVHVNVDFIDYIPELKEDYPDSYIMTIIHKKTPSYFKLLKYAHTRNLEIKTLLSNTIIDINDDGSLNEGENISDTAYYGTTCSPWGVIDYYMI